MKKYLAILIGLILLLTLPTVFRSPGSIVDGQTRATGESGSKKKPAKDKPSQDEEKPNPDGENSGEDEKEEEEEPEGDSESEEPENTDEKPTPVVDEPPASSGNSSNVPTKMFLCPKCGFTTDSEGDCPKCRVPLELMK